jgi:hypothetical protein
MLATHDSLTAYPVKFWLLKPFYWVCQCQNKTLEQQYAAGARSFDLRFAKFRGKWYAAHGAMLYNITLEEVMKKLAELPEPVYFRVLCEDTFYRKSDAKELAQKIHSEFRICADQKIDIRPLYIRSKRTWEMVAEYNINRLCADYPTCWDKTYTPWGMADAIDLMHSTQTTGDKMNFVACYSSKFIPRLTARILTKIALKKQWKGNDVPVIDFI